MDSREPWPEEFCGPGMTRKPNLFSGCCFLFLLPQGPPVAELYAVKSEGGGL